MKRPAIFLAIALLPAASVRGDESALKLKDAPGRDAVMTHCVLCHSVDYIQMNSPFLNRAGWEATVNKMIKAMGAPIKPEEVPPLVDYLSGQYGATP